MLFSNGTGVRCHVAGWGKDEFTGSFQFIQHKVDLPLMDEFRCNAALKLALNRRQSGNTWVPITFYCSTIFNIMFCKTFY